MHVLQLGPYPPPEGGISRNMLAIREALRERGGRCSIIATSRSSRMEPEPDVYRPSGAVELVRLLSKLDYDIVHLHVGGDLTNRVTGLMLACAFRGRGKSVLTFHSGGYAQENVELARPFSKAGFAFRSFDRIIGVNPLMIRMFEKFGVEPEKLSLILPFSLKSPDRSVEIPANIAQFIAASDPFLLTVCLLEDAYDLDMQVDAISDVLRDLPAAGLMIVGSGSLETGLRAAIASKPYSARIMLTGDLEHRITLNLIDRADILLRTTKFDGDAIAIREALHLGTPVIATDNGMRPEGVNLIPIHDPVALVREIFSVAREVRKQEPRNPDCSDNINDVIRIYEDLLG